MAHLHVLEHPTEHVSLFSQLHVRLLLMSQQVLNSAKLQTPAPFIAARYLKSAMLWLGSGSGPAYSMAQHVAQSELPPRYRRLGRRSLEDLLQLL